MYTLCRRCTASPRRLACTRLPVERQGHLHAIVLGEDRLSVGELPEQQAERVGVSRLIVPNLAY